MITAILLTGLLHGIVCLFLLLRYVRFFDLGDAPLIAAVEAQVAPLSVGIFLAAIGVLGGLGALKIFGPRAWKAILGGVALLNAIELWILFVDRQVYLVTRMHFDVRTLHVLSQPDAMSVIGVPPSLVIEAIFLGISTLAFSATLCWLANRLRRSAFRERLYRPSRYAGLVAMLVFLSERSVYAVVAPGMMTERSDPSVILPFADWLSVELPEDTVSAFFGLKSLYSRHEEFKHAVVLRHPSDLKYPAPEAMTWRPSARKHPNILVLVIESLRADAVDVATMPNLNALGQNSLLAHAHYSSSNCTHVGLFSLIYGLSPALWGPATELSLPPFAYELLRRTGYELSVTSSSSPRWFGLDRQAMRADLALGKYDAFADFDGGATEALIRFIEEKRERPFFALLFFNGSHFPYYVRPGEELFTPAAEQIDVGDPNLQSHRAEIVNRYRNALHRVDALLGQIFEALQQAGLSQDTIVAVTADHGESFWDDGRFAHTSLLSKAQLHVPFVVHIPGKSARRIDFLTTHVDVMPTLLDAAGIDLDPTTYSDGHSLLRVEAATPALAAQFSPDGIREFALLDGPLLVRFLNRKGRVALTGAEYVDADRRGGKAFLQAKAEKWPALLSALHHTARWWPAPE